MSLSYKQLDRIKNLLIRREHSKHEIKLRIMRSFEVENIEEILDDLESNNYLSEERFAHSRARHRASQGYGPNRLRQELLCHKISETFIEQAIAAVDWQAAWNIRFRKLATRSKPERIRIALRCGFHDLSID